MTLNMGPRLDETPPSYHLRRKRRRIGDVLAIAVAVALGGFLVVLITAILTAAH